MNKINKIITNIKRANLSNLSPQEVLEKLVPENEQSNSEYENLPSKWEDLFKLEISDQALEKQKNFLFHLKYKDY